MGALTVLPLLAALLQQPAPPPVYPLHGTLVHHLQLSYGAYRIMPLPAIAVRFNRPVTTPWLDQTERGYIPQVVLDAIIAHPRCMCAGNPIVLQHSLLGLFNSNEGPFYTARESVCTGDRGDNQPPPCKFTTLRLIQMWWRSWDQDMPYSSDGRWSCLFSKQ